MIHKFTFSGGSRDGAKVAIDDAARPSNADQPEHACSMLVMMGYSIGQIFPVPALKLAASLAPEPPIPLAVERWRIANAVVEHEGEIDITVERAN